MTRTYRKRQPRALGARREELADIGAYAMRRALRIAQSRENRLALTAFL